MASTTREPRLGIDIGRVIIDGPSHPDGGDTAFFSGDEATMLATPEMPGAVETVAELVARVRGPGLAGVQVRPEGAGADACAGLTGTTSTAVPGWTRSTSGSAGAGPDKRIHCEELRLTHFVDDRPDVHAAIRGVVHHHYLSAHSRDRVPDYAQHTATWSDAGRLILELARLVVKERRDDREHQLRSFRPSVWLVLGKMASRERGIAPGTPIPPPPTNRNSSTTCSSVTMSASPAIAASAPRWTRTPPARGRSA